MDPERYKTRDEVVSQIQLRPAILTPNDTLIELNELEDNKRQDVLIEHNLIFGEKKEENEKRLSTKLVSSMAEMNWLDDEKASGKGHFRFYPRGATIHSLLENVLDNFSLNDLEARRVITPLVFNWNDEQITGEVGTFYDDLYHVQSGANPRAELQILRFGFDMGVFKLMQDVDLQEDNLPVRIYETGIVLRSNKPGEKTNIQRADSFHIPSIYSFCSSSVLEGFKEFSYMHNHFSDFLSKLQLEYGHRFEIDENFFAKYRDQILSILNYDNKSALINLVSNKRHYFELKSDHFVDNAFKSFNIQIDTENATTYDIKYRTKNGTSEKKEPCIIIHSSLASIERWMLILLNNSLKHNPPELPLWLSPTQVRIIALNNEFDSSVAGFAKSLSSQGIRVDIDDREEKINKKIKYANKNLVPYVILFGRNEERTSIVNLRKRNGELIECDLDKVSDLIKSQMISDQINLTPSLTPVIRLSKDISLQ